MELNDSSSETQEMRIMNDASNLYSALFPFSIFKCALQSLFNHVGEIERQQMKAPLAAAISSLAISPNSPIPWMNVGDAYVRTDQHTGNSVPYSLRIVGGFFNVPQTYACTDGL